MPSNKIIPVKILFKTFGFVTVLATVWTSIPTSSKAASPNQGKYLFGVVPQQSATRLAQIWVPFLNHLSKKAGVELQFATSKDIPTFEKCLAKGAYEFAFMNPYHYTVFSKKTGYRAFAHQSKKMLKGVVVVRKDSTFKELADLSGKSLAFPSPAAFGASILPRAEMTHLGIQFEPKYVKSHDSVYRSVAAGLYAAGGGVGRTFGRTPEKIRNQLQIIHNTKKYTPHAFAAITSVPTDIVDRLRQAMAEVETVSPDLVKSLGMQGIQLATDTAWDDVRSLGLREEETQIEDAGDIKCRFD